MSTLDLTRDLDRSAITLDVELGGARPRRRRRGRLSDLVVERQDIWFESHPDDRDAVSIRIIVHNRGERASSPAVLHVQSAAFGAFLPWRPLTSVPLPRIAPGAAHTVELQARAGTPGSEGTLAPLPLVGGGMAMPPTSRGAAPARGGDGQEGIGRNEDARGGAGRHWLRLLRDASGPLGTAHWAGNLNVWVDGGPEVERHMSRGLRAVAGRQNLACFFVGSVRADGYRFHFSGEHALWSPRLYPLHGILLGHAAPGDLPSHLGDREWKEFSGPAPFILQFLPPAGSTSGELIVHVEQRSTGREALVEFGFDPEAAGPGCFTV